MLLIMIIEKKLIVFVSRTYPSSGPPSVRLYTWWGLSNLWKAASMSAPWPPPLLEFTSTRSGWLLGGNSSGCGEGGRDKTDLRRLTVDLRELRAQLLTLLKNVPSFSFSNYRLHKNHHIWHLNNTNTTGQNEWPSAKGRLGNGSFNNVSLKSTHITLPQISGIRNWLYF